MLYVLSRGSGLRAGLVSLTEKHEIHDTIAQLPLCLPTSYCVLTLSQLNVGEMALFHFCQRWQTHSEFVSGLWEQDRSSKPGQGCEEQNTGEIGDTWKKIDEELTDEL